MPLTSKQAFKTGFLLKCAEEGLTVEEAHTRVKHAIYTIKNTQGLTKEAVLPALLAAAYGAGNLGINAVKNIAWPVLSTAGTIGTGALLAGSAGAGYTAAKLHGGSEGVLDEAKQDEIIGEYERLAEEARRRTKLKKIQEQTGRRIVALTPSVE